MAHKKAGGSTRNGRDSNSKRLGVKRFGGQTYWQATYWFVSAALRFHAGENVGLGVITPCSQSGRCC